MLFKDYICKVYILQRVETSGQDKQKWRVFVSQIAWTRTISHGIIKKNESILDSSSPEKLWTRPTSTKFN